MNEREQRFAELVRELAPVATALFKRRDSAVLATSSCARPGYPSLSGIAFARAPEGWIIGLFSRLTPHHGNLVADGRCALMLVEENEGDMLTGERLELTCDARRLADETEVAAARDVYVARFPRSDAWFRQLDFDFFRFDVIAARYNGGFGRAALLTPEALGLPAR